MHEAISRMLDRYSLYRLEDRVNALREIIQEIALLGLWRSKFFDRAAFYGGSALRIIYELDRFSEDLDFSLLSPDKDFDIGGYGDALERELNAFGFSVRFEQKGKAIESPIHSAFLKANTYNQLLVIEPDERLVQDAHRSRALKIKLEIDTLPPPGFTTQVSYLLQPIPFSVRTYALPDLLAGKLHAVLCRRWKSRVKGRDWYDLVWYATHHPKLHLGHLEERMRQSGHWKENHALDAAALQVLLMNAIGELDVDQARNEVHPFVKRADALDVWSRDFFRDIAARIQAE